MWVSLFLFIQSFCSYNVFIESGKSSSIDDIEPIIHIADSLMKTLDPKPKNGNILSYEDGFLLLFDGYSSVYHFIDNQLIILGNDNFNGYNFGRTIFIKGDCNLPQK